MIGHWMNGGTVLAVAPAETADHHVVLHVAHYANKAQYATGLVHYSQMPKPTEWWVGNYFDRLEPAVEDFLARATTDPTHFAAEIVKAIDNLRPPRRAEHTHTCNDVDPTTTGACLACAVERGECTEYIVGRAEEFCRLPVGHDEPHDWEREEQRAEGLAARLRGRLREYDETLATPGQAQDIAEADLLHDVQAIVRDTEQKWRN